MSVISNRHSIIPFVSGQSVALHEQRLCKIGFKSRKGNAAAFTSRCVSIPTLREEEINDNLSTLLPMIRGMLEKSQDALIKERFVTSRGTLESIGDDEISLPAIIRFVEEEESGGRLTILRIEEWFGTALGESLAEFLEASAMTQYPDAEHRSAVVEKTLNGYKGMFAAMAGPKTHYDAGQRKKLMTVLGLVLCEDGSDEEEIAGKMIKKLEDMEAKDKKIMGDLGLIDFA